jgi:hypothetical protein
MYCDAVAAVFAGFFIAGHATYATSKRIARSHAARCHGWMYRSEFCKDLWPRIIVMSVALESAQPATRVLQRMDGQRRPSHAALRVLRTHRNAFVAALRWR